MYERDVLLKDLQEQVVKVTFTKVNGDRREMRCTLMSKHLPPGTDKNYLLGEHKKPENLNTLAVWDMDNGGWRSFRIESVEYVETMHQSYQ
jgi:hypothetical protein